VAGGRVVAGAEAAPAPDVALQAAELQAHLRHALSDMPEPERQVIVLAYQDELSQSEIADRLGWPIGTVKTRTRRALHRLRAVLTADEGLAALERAPARTWSGTRTWDDDGPR
jgi:RNA polymerase sigma-70 factor (ECF subfamily)